MSQTTQSLPKVVSPQQWREARTALLAKEKELTRLRDAVNTQRRLLPMVKIEKAYSFDGPAGKVRLLDLFEGRRQLEVYHFMFDPSWEEGCPSCSFVVDNIGHLSHLHARDTTLVLVSRAPLAKIVPFKSRMGWTIPWYSSFGSDFNYDFHVSHDEQVAPIEYNYTDRSTLVQKGESFFTQGETHGLSVFLRDGEHIYRTYFTTARGAEALGSVWTFLDLTPLGRQEEWEDSPEGYPQTKPYQWWRRHDEYDGKSAD